LEYRCNMRKILDCALDRVIRDLKMPSERRKAFERV
jgi:hypothetical protein